MAPIPDSHLNALHIIDRRLEDQSITWALTGSTSFAIQGVPLEPNDIDVQTTEAGAYAIEESFSEQMVDPVTRTESDEIQSHFGAFELRGVRVELMGALRTRRTDGSWSDPIDIPEHRTYETVGDLTVPVLSLGFDAEMYERYGRERRASLLSDYANE